MTYYELFTEQKDDPAVGRYETYGIRASDSVGTVRVIGDLSDDRDKVSALAALFNEEDLSPEHLEIAVEEFLYDFEV